MGVKCNAEAEMRKAEGWVDAGGGLIACNSWFIVIRSSLGEESAQADGVGNGPMTMVPLRDSGNCAPNKGRGVSSGDP